MQINFREFQDQDELELVQMIKDLYEDDPDGQPMNELKINATFQYLRNYPESGKIFCFETAQQIVGYSILINYWSNEYGGNMLNIDELFVKEAYRSKGIGTEFIKYLIQTNHSNFKAIELEVIPENTRAASLYKNIGFKKVRNNCLRMQA